MGDPGRAPRYGVPVLPPVERNVRDTVVPSGGRVLDVVSVLDNGIDPGDWRIVFVSVIPRARRYPLLGRGRSSTAVVGAGGGGNVGSSYLDVSQWVRGGVPNNKNQADMRGGGGM